MVNYLYITIISIARARPIHFITGVFQSSPGNLRRSSSDFNQISLRILSILIYPCKIVALPIPVHVGGIFDVRPFNAMRLSCPIMLMMLQVEIMLRTSDMPLVESDSFTTNCSLEFVVDLAGSSAVTFLLDLLCLGSLLVDKRSINADWCLWHLHWLELTNESLPSALLGSRG